MLKWALLFFVVALLAALLGFTSVAGATYEVAKLLAAMFVVLFFLFLLLGKLQNRQAFS